MENLAKLRLTSRWRLPPSCHIIWKRKFGHVRSKLPSSSKQVLRHLRSFRKLRDCKVSIVMIHEYMTPKICAHCHQTTLKHAREPTSAGSQHGNQIHTVLQLSELEHSVKSWCDDGSQHSIDFHEYGNEQRWTANTVSLACQQHNDNNQCQGTY
jgi:hypothetical protein